MHFRSLLIILLIGGVVTAGNGVARADAPLSIVASNWKFTPAKIEAHVGTPTVMSLSSTEGVHGIGSTDLGIPATMIAPGKTTSVTFTPSKVGTYALHCSIVCGTGHENMMLTVDVVK